MARCVSGDEGALSGLTPVAGAIDALFARFDAELKRQGCLALGGQISDATIIDAPKQRLTADAHTPPYADQRKPPSPIKPSTSQTQSPNAVLRSVHLHTLWTLPEGDADFSGCCREEHRRSMGETAVWYAGSTRKERVARSGHGGWR